jgi:hypothetical protein
MAFFDDSSLNSYLNVGNLQIVFRGKQCAGSPGASFPFIYQSTQATNGPSSPLKDEFACTAFAYYNAPTSGDPTNKATLDSYTQQFATDFTNWRKLTFDLVFAGVAVVLQSGLLDTTTFVYGDKGEMPTTRIKTFPFNNTFQELGAYDYTNDCLNTTDTMVPNFDCKPYICVYGPPGACVNGHLQLTRKGIALMDGRLVEKYFSQDTFQ